AEEMRRIELAVADAAAKRGLERGARAVGELARHEGCDLGVLAQGKNCLAVGAVGDLEMPIAGLLDRVGIGAEPGFGAGLLDEAEPGLAGELEKPAGRRTI